LGRPFKTRAKIETTTTAKAAAIYFFQTRKSPDFANQNAKPFKMPNHTNFLKQKIELHHERQDRAITMPPELRVQPRA